MDATDVCLSLFSWGRYNTHTGFLKMDVPQNGWFTFSHIFTILLKWMIWGYPYFRKPYPIGSMYGIYGNIDHQYTPNVSIYIPYIRILCAS